MSKITRVGVDLAKRVIQIHAVDEHDKLVTNKALPRDRFLAWCSELPSGCVIAMEACSAAHHWTRKLQAMGFDVRMMAAHLVSPYRLQGKSGKNDANDAQAVCEAASRPSMRFVPVKSIDQQGMLSVHRLREGFKEERTACINRIRGLLAEFGVVMPQDPSVLRKVLTQQVEEAQTKGDLPPLTALVIQQAYQHWVALDERLDWCYKQIAEHLKQNEQVQIAEKIMGIGPVTASAVVATVGDFKQFKNGAQFGAWLGLTPRQNSSGGKAKLGGITKRGDMYLRTLLIQAAKSAVMTAEKRHDPISQWVCRLKERSGWQKTVVALANKNARILWAVMVRGKGFDPRHVSVKPQRREEINSPGFE